MNAICRDGPKIAANLCKVLSNTAVTAEYRLLVAKAPQLALTAVPGQFFHLLCPAVEDQAKFMLRRPMSIYRIDRDNQEVAFLYKVTGRGTRGLATLQPGDTLDALGPLGKGFNLPADTRHVLLIARGVGLATLTPLAAHAKAQGAHITAVLSARNEDAVLSRDELRAAGATVITVLDTDGSSAPEKLRSALDKIQIEQPFDYVATCGSNRLFHLTQAFCAQHGIAGEVALEARMGCGTGMCYACVAPIRQPDGSQTLQRVCWDGPVFAIEEATGW